ncbi:MAG: InlB B-repeat-containing protein, partial [Corallococcus sp.]|nr:InlB B-repeat-containing protein [Corallococcus sp.]
TAENGYEFDGWSDGTAKYAAGAEYTMPAQAVTFTAQWKAVVVPPAITDEINGVIMHSGTLANGNKTAGTLVLYSNGKGYVYVVNVDRDVALIEYDEITYTISQDGVFTITGATAPSKIVTPAVGKIEGNKVTITIQNGAATGATLSYVFESEIHALTLNFGYSNGGSTTYTAYYPAETALDLTEFVDRTGYTLTGFNVDGTSKNLNYGKLFSMPNEDTTVTYVWEQIQSVSYKVTYKAGEGQGEDYVVTATTSSYKLIYNTATNFTREGYAFAGWSVNGQDYNTGDTVTLTGDTVVTARWRQSFAVTLAGLDVSGVSKSQTFDKVYPADARYNEVSKFTLPLGSSGTMGFAWVKRSGFTLTGWLCSADNQVYAPGTQLAITQNTTFTAQWSSNLQATDFEGTWESEEGLVVEDASLEIKNFAVKGNTVTGDLSGELTVNGNEATLTVGGINEFKFTVDGNILTVTLKRLSATYTGTFTKFVPTDKTLTDYQGYYLGAITFNNTDYDSARIEGTTLYLQEGAYSPDEFALTEDKTDKFLVATYTKTVLATTETITLTFNAEGGFTIVYEKTDKAPVSATFSKTQTCTVSFAMGQGYEGSSQTPASQQVLAGNKVVAPPETPKWTGYRFLGWFAPEATEAFDFNEAVTASVELTAKWAQIEEVTVTFDTNAQSTGVTAPASQTIAFNATATEPTDASVVNREGYRFDGWRVGSLSGALFDFATPVTEDITLYAKWSRAHTVTYAKPDGAEGEVPANETVYANDTYTFAANPFTMEGYDFLGWKNGAANTLYKTGATLTVNGNLALTAVFGKTYTNNDNESDIPSLTTRTDLTDKVQIGMSTYSYVKTNGVLEVTYGFASIYVKLNDDGTFDELDEMAVRTFTAANGTVMTFDGMGGLSLGQITGTYVGVYEYNEWSETNDLVSLNINVGGVAYNNVALVISLNEDFMEYIYVINVKITVDGTDYIFGNPAVEWTVSFELGEGVTGSAPEAIKVMSNVAVATLPNGDGFAKEGYRFVGWVIDGEDMSPLNGVVEVVGSVTYVPSWTQLFTLSFAAGEGATGEVAAMQCAADEQVTLPDATGLTAPQDKQFAGWTDGSETYAAGSKYTMPANDATLTATWEEGSTPTPPSTNIWVIDSNGYITGVVEGETLSGVVTVPQTVDGVKVVGLKGGTNGSGSVSPFKNSESITKVILPEGLTTIEGYVFYCSGSYTSSLTEVELPSTLTTIGKGAFYNCKKMTISSLPQSLTSIGDSAFYNCESLDIDLVIPVGVTIIEGSAFVNCKSLKSITLHSNIATIKTSAFSGCSGVRGTITISHSLTTLGGSAFKGITNAEFIITADLTSINLTATVSSNVFDTSVNIYVADELYDSFIASSTWTNYTGRLKKLSERTA